MPGTQMNVNASATFYYGHLYILANNPVPDVAPLVSSGQALDLRYY